MNSHDDTNSELISFFSIFFSYCVCCGGFASSAGSDDDDDEADPEVKVVKEKERRQANNARERYVPHFSISQLGIRSATNQKVK